MIAILFLITTLGVGCEPALGTAQLTRGEAVDDIAVKRREVAVYELRVMHKPAQRRA
ncbi:MAG: hypothetical protein M3N35_02235 [Candidatus Binatota bacterium]|nr:hypothetical protein [Candidatus Binatota bacterium]